MPILSITHSSLKESQRDVMYSQSGSRGHDEAAVAKTFIAVAFETSKQLNIAPVPFWGVVTQRLRRSLAAEADSP